jgi:hypothetical protein
MSLVQHIAAKEPLSKVGKGMLDRLRKTKVKNPVYLRSWSDIFSDKPILMVLLPFLHALDIIHLAVTCRSLYARYYGNSLKKILIPLVERDLRSEYKTSPFKYLGKHRNLEEINTPYGQRFIAKQCIFCGYRLSRRDLNRSRGKEKQNSCWDCDNVHSLISILRSNLLASLVEKYGPLNELRIRRILDRSSLKYGSELSAETGCPGTVSHVLKVVRGECNRPHAGYDHGYDKMIGIVTRMLVDIQNQVAHLDLRAPLITVPRPKQANLQEYEVSMLEFLPAPSATFRDGLEWFDFPDSSQSLEPTLKRDRDHDDLLPEESGKILELDYLL